MDKSFEFDFNLFEMSLILNKFTEEGTLKEKIVFPMSYTYLIDKDLYDEKKQMNYKKDIFAYTLDLHSPILKNDQEVSLTDFTDKEVLSIVKETLFLEEAFDRQVLKLEPIFNENYLVLIHSVNKELRNCIKIKKIL